MKFHKTLLKVRRFEEGKREQQEEAAYKAQEDRHKRMQMRDQRIRQIKSIESKRIQQMR